jgi:integrase
MSITRSLVHQPYTGSAAGPHRKLTSAHSVNQQARAAQVMLHGFAFCPPELFLDIYKAVGLKDASSHSGRRTYITRLANKGVGVRLLAALAGHSHISTTQRYIDVNAEQLSAAVELL